MPEFGLSYSEAGLVMSIGLLPYALMQVPSGLLSDRWGPRRILLLFLAIAIVGNVAFMVAGGYPAILTSQIIIGFGSSVVFICAVKIIEAWLPSESLGRNLGVLSAASSLGSFIAYSGLPLLHSTFKSWRPAYMGLTLAMVGALALIALLVRDKPKAEEKKNRRSLEVLRSVASNRVLLPLFVGYFISGFNWCFWSWMPKFLVDTKGFSYVDAGFVASISTATSIVGCVIVGAVSDRLRKRKLPLAVFAAMDSFMLALIILLPSSTTVPAFFVSCAILGITSTMWVLPYAMVAETLPRSLSGVGLGLLNFLGYVGSIVMTPIFGSLIDRTGSYALSNQLVVAISIIVFFVYSAFVKDTYPRSADNPRRVIEENRG
jgi:nitrate/nitrite transporter NarK